jgi:inhibitor of cysteine peptidase
MALEVSGILHVAEVTLTEAENGAHVDVRVGDTVTIHLSENSAAGYRWTISSLDEKHIVVKSHSYQPMSAAVGSAGTAVWRLSARRAGTTRVELEKSRPWEPADSARERFAVDLIIE